MTATVCPQCGGPIPNATSPGAYPGALSRRDPAIEICSDCGLREALEDYSRSRGAADPEAEAEKLFTEIRASR